MRYIYLKHILGKDNSTIEKLFKGKYIAITKNDDSVVSDATVVGFIETPICYTRILYHSFRTEFGRRSSYGYD